MAFSPQTSDELVRSEARQTRFVVISCTLLCTLVLSLLVIGITLANSKTGFSTLFRVNETEPVSTGWVTFDQYQKEFDIQSARRFFPVWKEGRVKDGKSQYRAVFVPYRERPFGYISHTGMDHATFLAKSELAAKKNYILADFQVFTDEAGIPRYQALWLGQRAAKLHTADAQPTEKMTIYVSGAVRQPGQFTVAKNISLLAALAVAGGPNDYADLKKLKIAQPGQDERIITDKDTFKDVTLVEGDTVIVPQSFW